MALNIALSLLLVVIGLFYYWVHKKFTFFEEHGFKHKKAHFPFGNLKGVGKDFHIVELIVKYYNEFKGQAPAFGMYFFTNPTIVLTDIDLIKDVLIKDFDNFHNRGVYYNTKDDPLSGHLFAIEDSSWKNLRSKLTPTFTSGKMKLMFGTVLDISDTMISKLKNESDQSAVEVKDILGKFTTDVIGNVAFGLEMNSIKDPNSMFRKMGRKIFKTETNLQLKIFLLTSFRNIARKLGLMITQKDVSSFFLSSIKETVEYRLKNKIQRNDFMDLLLKMYNKTGEPNSDDLTLNQLSAQCFIFFLAGFETSSSTATFVLYLLAMHQEIQDKLRNEIKAVIAKHNNIITYDGMMEMTYLQMVIDETLRLYGPIFNLVRTASNDYKIPNSNLIIPKGSLVFIPNYAIHNDADYYPAPAKFDPERFSDENKHNRHPMTHIPFGEGPRNCIGSRFGYMQTKIALIKLLLNFKFFTSHKTTKPMKFDPKSFVLAPLNDMWLKVENL